MHLNLIKNELHNVLSGKSEVRFGRTLQSIASYLRDGQGTSAEIEEQKQFKKQEEERLKLFINSSQLWLTGIDFNQYISEGAEQRVFLKDNKHVIKLNDSIYYSSWLDYINNLLLHNYFFSDTAYELLGFTTENDILYVVVQQNFVTTDSLTDIDQIKSFLRRNGFQTIATMIT